MSTVLEARAVISAVDQTRGAFDSFEHRVKAASAQTKALGTAMSNVGRMSGPMSEVTGTVGRAEAALNAFGQSARAVDEVSAAVARAAKTMPQLANQAAALSKVSTETASAGRALAAELARIDTAGARLGVFKTLQGGFNEARKAFAGAKASVQDFAHQIEASDAKVRKLKADMEVAKVTSEHAWAAGSVGGGTHESMRPYQAAMDDRHRINAEIEAETAARKTLERGYGAAQTKVSSVARAFEQQKAAIIGVKREIESLAGGPMKSISGMEAKLKADVEGVNHAMIQQAQVSRRVAEAGGAALHAERRKAHGAYAGHGGSQFAELASLYGTIEAAEVAHRVIERYREFDKERRYGRVVMGLTDKEQEPLVDQAIHESGNSKFNDIQWLETQRELASRGYNLDQVKAFTPIAAHLGQAFDVSMPEGVKALEGAMLSFRKDISTPEKALASASRTGDMQVKASKISGMNFEDIVQLYKYGAAPAQMAHLSEESLLAFGAISKKSNMGGDESGVAFRALAKNLISPTAGAQVAMRASGIDYNAYQKMPDHLDSEGFFDTVAKRYGIKLNDKIKAGVSHIFNDKALIGDAAAFTPAITKYLQGALGGKDAKSLKSIAGMARSYRDASARDVDTNGLMVATITAISKTPALANAIFGPKQGGRIFAALGDPAVFQRILEEIKNQSKGFSREVSDERMAGFDGAVSKLQNALANVESALGRAWDNNGSGGLMTEVTAAAARLTQAFAEASPEVQRTATEVMALGAAAAAMRGFGLFRDGFGIGKASLKLDGSALKLDGSAMQLDAAARALQLAGGKSGLPGGVPPVVPEDVPKMKGPELAPETLLGKGGFKGLGSSLAEGIVGAVIYEVGKAGIHVFEEKALGWTPEDRERIDKIDPWADNWAGTTKDNTSGDDPWLSGERPAIERRSKIAEDEFKRDPEAARGRHPRNPSDPWLGDQRALIERLSQTAVDDFNRDPEAARGRHLMTPLASIPAQPPSAGRPPTDAPSPAAVSLPAPVINMPPPPPRPIEPDPTRPLSGVAPPPAATRLPAPANLPPLPTDPDRLRPLSAAPPPPAATRLPAPANLPPLPTEPDRLRPLSAAPPPPAATRLPAPANLPPLPTEPDRLRPLSAAPPPPAAPRLPAPANLPPLPTEPDRVRPLSAAPPPPAATRLPAPANLPPPPPRPIEVDRARPVRDTPLRKVLTIPVVLPDITVPAALAPPPPSRIPSIPGADGNGLPVRIVGSIPSGMPTRAFPAGVQPDFTLGNRGTLSPGFGSDDHFGPWPAHRAPPVETVTAAHDAGLVAHLDGLIAATREARQPHEDILGKLGLIRPTIEGPITAQLQGSATVTANITVGPSSELLSIVSRAQSLATSGHLTGGGTSGSVGPTRTEAAPGVGKSR